MSYFSKSQFPALKPPWPFPIFLILYPQTAPQAAYQRVSIKISNQRNSYKFTLNRNITILRGDSGTGKTTLYDMIRDYNNLGRESGVKISGGNIVTLEGKNWEDELDKLNNAVIVIDEGSKFVFSKEFASKVKGCNNYFLIITRSYLSQLPYSVDEIYRIKGTGKNKEFERKHHHN